MKAAVLDGRVFGRLTVLKRMEKSKDGVGRWLCRCECGKTTVVSSTRLIRGLTKSCGCLIGGPLSLEGQRFGKLEVLIESELSKGSRGERRAWVCLCDCGELCVRTTGDLRTKMVSSCGCLRRGIKEDLTDKRYGRWTVLCCAGKKKRTYVWKCACDCGKEKYVSGEALKKGDSTSCGCYHLDKVRELKLPPGESSFNALFSSYRFKATECGRVFELSKDDFRRMTSQRCFYCDEPPLQVMKSKRTSVPYMYNGLDRIDSNGGYTYGNVVTCCKKCNLMKKNMAQEHFLSHVEKIYKATLCVIKKE